MKRSVVLHVAPVQCVLQTESQPRRRKDTTVCASEQTHPGSAGLTGTNSAAVFAEAGGVIGVGLPPGVWQAWAGPIADGVRVRGVI